RRDGRRRVGGQRVTRHPGRALFQPPPSEPGLRLSPHPALQCSPDRGSVVAAAVDLSMARLANYERLSPPRDHHGFAGCLRPSTILAEVRELADVVDLNPVPTPAQLAAIGLETFDEFGPPVPRRGDRRIERHSEPLLSPEGQAAELRGQGLLARPRPR